MTTLQDLLNSYYRKALAYGKFHEQDALKELQDTEKAILEHVEQAMTAALEMGKRVGCSDGVGPFITGARQVKWEMLVREWKG